MGLPSILRRFWNDWNLRVVMLVNLVLQVALTLGGHRRKSNQKLRLRILIWVAYMSMNSVTSYGLAIISTKLSFIQKTSQHGEELDDGSKLMAFWAPTFLFFLGGPDTITAYGLEDNELWLRTLLELAVQTVATGYIFIMSWSWSQLLFLKVLMLVVALTKYGERTWALWLASADKFRESMLSPADPSLNYPRFMEQYVLKEEEGYIVRVHELIERPVPSKYTFPTECLDAYSLLQIFKRLFVDLILSEDDRHRSLELFKDKECGKAYSIIELELESMYDMLYTKATVLQSRWGLIRRSVSISVTIFVMVYFYSTEKPHYQTVDLTLTYVSLASIVVLEFYSFLWLLSSNWAIVQRNKKSSNSRSKDASIITAMLGLSKWIVNESRWSHSVAQLKFLRFCCKHKTVPCQNILKKLKLLDKIEKYYFTSHETVLDDVKKDIYSNLKNKSQTPPTNSSSGIENQSYSSSVQKYKFKRALEMLLTAADLNRVCSSSSDLRWCWELEFDQCILLWHIATELCLYVPNYDDPQQQDYHHQNVAKKLSRYMFYLLVRYPTILPSGIGLIRLRDTFAEADIVFKERDSLLQPSQDHKHSSCWEKFLLSVFHRDQLKEQRNRDEENIHKQCCKILLQVDTRVPPSKVKGGMTKSVLFDGCRLADELNKWDITQKWKLISNVWIEILYHAARKSSGHSHAQQLRRGGELLTHVWLMMAHFGLTDHFQLTENNVIADISFG